MEFPLLVTGNIRPIILAMAVFLFGTLFSFILTVISADNAAAFLSSGTVEEILNRDLAEHAVDWDAGIQSNFIFTNNIRVSILVFVLGITLGAGSAYILLYNGYMLGSLAGLSFIKNENIYFWALILPHGIIELIAVFICGGAGFIIGYSLINPGKYSRKDSFIIKGEIALKLVVGTIPLFIVAGLIEGYFTPTRKVTESFKLIFSAFTLVLFILYIAVPNVKQGKKLTAKNILKVRDEKI